MTKTVLVVDDDPAIRELVVMALEARGYSAMTAVAGDALRVARERSPDLILLDLVMPGMDGVEVSRQLRADPQTANIPIVAMSAIPTIHIKAATMPADDKLAKPFDLTDLYATIDAWAEG